MRVLSTLTLLALSVQAALSQPRAVCGDGGATTPAPTSPPPTQTPPTPPTTAPPTPTPAPNATAYGLVDVVNTVTSERESTMELIFSNCYAFDSCFVSTANVIAWASLGSNTSIALFSDAQCTVASLHSIINSRRKGSTSALGIRGFVAFDTLKTVVTSADVKTSSKLCA